jgi:hypothetical protein
MNKLVIAGLALSALFVAGQESHAYVNYPWCIHGDSRGLECSFTTKEQCAMDGRNRGFGGQCMANPFYKPNQGTVVEAQGAQKSGRRHKPRQ